MTASVAADSRIWILVYFPWKCVAALVALFSVGCFAILNRYSTVIYTGFHFFSVALVFCALSSLSFVTAPKLDSSDDEADISSLEITYTFTLKESKSNESLNE